MNFEDLSPKEFIIIKGAAVNNLKKIDVAIPRNKMVVVTGVSGSGKSSLAFDTLYAEGQRRYVESLSSYARQFLGKMDKPEVDYIKGIAPAIAIEQKVNTRNPRSTVGTATEIYDYLKLLYARIGVTYSPVSGLPVQKHNVQDVIDAIHKMPNDIALLIVAPVEVPNATTHEILSNLQQKGFVRVLHHNHLVKIEDLLPLFENEKSAKKAKPKKGDQELPVIETEKKATKKTKTKKGETVEENKSEITDDNAIEIKVVVDRIMTAEHTDEYNARLADSVQTAFYEGRGTCYIAKLEDGNAVNFQQFSNKFEADGITFEEPTANLFAFNNPYGACKRCEGFGSIIGVDPDLVIPDKSKSVYEGAIVCWVGEKMSTWLQNLIMTSFKFDFPIHNPYYDLTAENKQLLWTGNKYFQGLNAFFEELEKQSYKIQYRVMLSRYRGKTVCPDCNGTRLRADANYVKIDGIPISQLVLMPVQESYLHFKNLKLNAQQQVIAKRLLLEITHRLQYLNDVGLGYLTLNRLSNTLSGGESQRINLATSLGSSLVGSMYILDEPSIGLHPRDTERLITVLKSLQKLGNTVIIVEHDEAIMRSADQLIDIGPFAGVHGGHLVFQGHYKDILDDEQSLTAKYLTGKETINIPRIRRRWKNYIQIAGARENNLKNVTAKFPLNILTAVTGVSGSGKTSLIKKILFPALKKMHGGYGEATGNFDRITGDYNMISDVEMIDQNPIGKSSRSNPVTYVKAYDEIRQLYADLPLSRTRRLKTSHFSFNVDGGRCETCQGEGFVTIEMQFMADIRLKCDACKGKRFKEEILSIKYRDTSIDQILDMTVDEALDFFDGIQTLEKFKNAEKKISNRIQPLADVGLGYITLGQASSTLSGGEAQRIKLASYLTRGHSATGMLFIFDEPTTGLHFHDISKLLDAFNALIKQGNTVIVIEHNQEIIKCADWVIDLGPEGGDAGGNIVFEGTPEDLLKCNESYTAKFLKEKFEGVEEK
ncbi:MAG TPA: excinuclease ABC subunit UvrA [Bacteroidia bacterium]|nr:excinuclease ABC subunit UvrA [Bacteroidia bacterium]